MSRNNNSKGNKNSEYSINQGLTEKLRSLHKTLFFVISQFIRRKIKDYPIRVMTITFKDKIPSFLRSDIVYKFQCGSCNVTYYGKNKRPFKIRMSKILGISALTGKRVKVMMIPPLQNIFYSAVTHLILKISQFLQPTIMNLKSR